MECNKDEAVRAKQIAEKKFIERDYAGAKKFVLKAQSLYPDLEGLTQMLSALNVYISAENRILSGEVDWYCVLGVDYWADDKTVRKQYHKLALMLHPDKNKFVGADGAFKLVQEGWVLLSGKEKRLAYNQKLNPMGRQQRASTQTKATSAQHNVYGFHNNNSAATSHIKALNENENTWSVPISVPSSSQNLDKSLTVCSRCNKTYDGCQSTLCPHFRELLLRSLKKVLNHPRTQRAALRSPGNSQRNVGQSSGCKRYGLRSSTSVASTLTADVDQRKKKTKKNIDR